MYANRARPSRCRSTCAAERRLVCSTAHVDLQRLGRARFAYIRLGYAAREELASLAGLLSPAPFVIIPLDTVAPRWLTAVVAPASVRDRIDAALRVGAFEPVAVSADIALSGLEELQQRVATAERQEREGREALTVLKREVGDVLKDLAQRSE